MTSDDAPLERPAFRGPGPAFDRACQDPPVSTSPPDDPADLEVADDAAHA